jgi:predicted alpha/beta hydrolase family esterase
MAHHIIYLPGLGDHANAQVQIKFLEKWRKKDNLEPHFVHINWNDNEVFADKLNKVIKLVDELSAQNGTVSIVAASAGCSMAISAYCSRKDKINRVILICGKIRNPGTINSNRKSKNPSLMDAVTASDSLVNELSINDKAKMLTLRPVVDETVTKSDGTIPGVKDKILFSIEHGLSIILAISLYKKIAINFIKSKSVQ